MTATAPLGEWILFGILLLASGVTLAGGMICRDREPNKPTETQTTRSEYAAKRAIRAKLERKLANVPARPQD